ncbi:hypothetical protein TUM20983_27520 [Mycobacterium antarcticum]|uniref:RNA polymerase sigma factor n=1 Tax=unclassified Mycolicibacterium TaxID=2636767 RepID=UPI002396F602|nr:MULTISPECIES: RNA polymerase sigma factor [unclassified Mycolicibacterium]GLP75642.1 hypothetical protein TUM20983_27520 [Mycolicibacterium sp. TUM20983]GLP84007.1 hypothetical protein TUM20984_54270 [Mycolicibacterium sp. TUM20984]
MTVAPAEFDDAPDDAELASAAAQGDRAAFSAIYDRYADRLYDFCAGMLRDTDAAADCVQDVYVDAATQLGALRDPSRLRPWLYSMARNQALKRIRARRREMPTDELPEFDSGEPDLATLAARSELADLIADACGGLSERDRTVFELTYRHGLDGTELADALGVSHTNANTLTGRLRDGIERSLGALLVCRGAKTDPSRCPELASMLDDWDGTFTVLMRKRAARHIDGCTVCEEERRRRVNPVALLGGVPVFIPAPAALREPTLTAASRRLPAAPQPTRAVVKPHLSGSQGRQVRTALVAVFVILGIAGVAQVWAPMLVREQPVSPVSEVDLASTDPLPTRTPLNGSASLAPSVPSTTAAPSEPVRRPTTTVVTTAETTAAPTRTTDKAAPTTSTTRVSSFSPTRSSSSTERTTQTRTRTSTSTATATSTVTSSSSSSAPPTPTTTTSDPIE